MRLVGTLIATVTLASDVQGQVCGDRLIFRRQCAASVAGEPPLVFLGSLADKTTCQAACEDEMATNPLFANNGPGCCQYDKVGNAIVPLLEEGLFWRHICECVLHEGVFMLT